MKSFLIGCLLSLLALSAFPPVVRAQFPVRHADGETIKILTAPFMATAKNSGSPLLSRPQVTSATTANMSVTVEPGKRYLLQGIHITCDRPYWIGVNVRKQGSANYPNFYENPYFTLGEKATDIILPYNEELFEGGIVTVTGVPMSGTATQDQGFIGMRLIGRTQSLYELDNADYRIVVIGDSKALYALEQGTYGERYYVNQLVRNLQSQGKRVSVIDKTMPGSSSSDGVRLIKSGALEGIKYDLLIWAFGTNNAGTTATAAVITQFKADQTEAILHRNRTNPNASLIYVTPGVTDKSTLVSNIDAYRTAVSDVATDATLGGTARKVYLCQEHTAFTISSSVKSDHFSSIEPLGSQLHYTMIGHDDVYNNVFLPLVKTTDFYKNVLKLN